MPILTLDNGSIEPDLNKITCQFAFTMDEQVVYGFIGSEKFHKHMLPVDISTAKTKQSADNWGKAGVIKPQGNIHTALVPNGFGAIRPLYEFFARDFIREFQKRGAFVGELEYTREELQGGGPVPPGILVHKSPKVTKKIDVENFHFLRVGAIVRNLAAGKIQQIVTADQKKPDQSIAIVYFQHGPLVE